MFTLNLCNSQPPTEITGSGGHQDRIHIDLYNTEVLRLRTKYLDINFIL